ncbi:MAG TPA: alpha-amylase family glycosyl hydrolase, partial [Pseudolabrys sp.]|nr:alpha-amylase family glycosyl hydrolase [Pseudolabrys sp.]
MPPAVPLATYRLQLTKDFGFDQAAALAPYLKGLGITHLYASPFLKARPGSTHGYDIVDHDQINPELGGEEGFARLSEALKANDLGLILDFVPNHMGVAHADNAWWLDVLEWGPHSPYAASFDIDWDALPHRRHPGVLLPILGRAYGDALQAGEIELKYDAGTGSFAAWYFDHKLPINPQRYSEILRTVVAAARAEQEPAGRALLAIADEYGAAGAP